MAVLDHCGDFTHLPGEYAKWDDVAGYSRDIRDLASGLMRFASVVVHRRHHLCSVSKKTIVDLF